MIAAALVAVALLSPSVPNRWEVVEPYNAKLERIQECETGNYKNPWHLNTGNGYYGGLQFSMRTWKNVGGRKRPDQNTKLEQKYRAVILINMGYGYTPWPLCGRQ